MPRSRVIGVALLAALLLTAHSRASTFVDVTANAGLNHLQYDLPDPPTERDFQTYLTGGAAAADYNGDGFLDLHTTEWRLTFQNTTNAPGNARLLRNRGVAGPGTFDDVTQAAGVALDDLESFSLVADSQSFASRFSDLDRDGHPDLAIAGDHGTSRLFFNNGHLFDVAANQRLAVREIPAPMTLGIAANLLLIGGFHRRSKN